VGHMSDLPYSFFLQRSAGDLMMRLNSNTTVREILTASTLSTLLDGSLVALYLLLIVVESPRIALLVIGLAVAQIAILLLSRRRYQRLMSENLDAQARSQSYLVQMLAGIETLKSTGAEPRAVEHWSNLFVNEINVSISRGRLSAIIDSAVGALRIGSPLAILAFGGYEVVRGEITLGRMLAASALAAGFLIPLSTMVTTALQVFTLRSYMERINDVLDTEADRRYAITSPAPALGGRITVEAASFKYGPLAPLAVDDVSLEIEPGQFVAIVGRSGSGKSTLANLILGLYEPTSGRVLYDGIDLSSIEARSLRQQLGIVPQHPYLFGSSIRDNIALADPATPLDKVMEAADLARIHDDITAMPMGYETVLADGGATLSGGQRQRIALARALVMKPKVLLLDEATSSLDAGTETEVYRNLEGLDCTRLVIAHRLSTVRRAAQVIVLEGGKLVESGTHRKLVSMKGHYSELISAQTG
ncbi:MAG TPA: peptidase domain-containing ABC transporter, partial [Actinomycetota bacterium]|nr:peptidase domain-containing ABC transporter [Actinomycetota bacterium]